MAQSDGDGMIAGVFTSKLVGALFAIAFGAWAIVLSGVKSDFLESQAIIQKDVAELKAGVYRHELFSAQKVAEMDAKFRETERRLLLLEDRHRNGARHTVAAGGE